VETQGDEGRPPGYRARAARLGPLVGAKALGLTVYDLDPGESVAPYHYEYGNEEWLIVLAGKPTLRDADGDEYELAPWDIVLFPEGPEGAHKVSNRTDEPVRVAMLSTTNEPSVAVYPDSGKIGVWTERGADGRLFRLDDAVDYWEGEAERPAAAAAPGEAPGNGAQPAGS
jgi:uncharacterized cupin superfamily protein